MVSDDRELLRVAAKVCTARQLEAMVLRVQGYGYKRLSLETGTAESFTAAHRLYESLGFARCGAFGDYQHDPHSVFMTLALDRQLA